MLYNTVENTWSKTYVYLPLHSHTASWSILQCPLGFATLGKAAALALATSRALTDLRQYINSDLGYSDLKIGLLYSK